MKAAGPGEDGHNQGADPAAAIQTSNPAVSVFPKERIPDLPPDIRRIHERGKLIVAMYAQDRFPYFFVDPAGRLTGSDVELARDLAHQLGIQDVEFDRSAQTFDEIIANVNRGKADMGISKISVTLNRAQQVLYSDPYVKLNQAILLNRIQFSRLKAKNGEQIEALRSRALPIGALGGTSYMEFAQQSFPQASIRPFDNFTNLIEAVKAGEIIAAYYDEFEFKRYLLDHPETLIDLQLLVMKERKDDLAIALPPASVNLQQWVNTFLRNRPPIQMEAVLNTYRDSLPGTKKGGG
ncbi:ABC transporter substrate-binding protein [Paenibacillus sp. HJGM_3]